MSTPMPATIRSHNGGSRAAAYLSCSAWWLLSGMSDHQPREGGAKGCRKCEHRVYPHHVFRCHAVETAEGPQHVGADQQCDGVADDSEMKAHAPDGDVLGS